MSGSSDTETILKRARVLTWRARALLFWERYAPVFALAGLCLALFLIAAFSGLWERIGDPWRLISLIATLICLAWAGWRARDRHIPTRSDARRRVETDSGVAHRPLDTLEDQPALGETGWRSHFAHAKRLAENLKAPKGRPTLSPIDPYYLRFIMPVFLGLAMMVGAGDNFERLKRSLTPTWQAGITPEDVTFEVWADPPDYTGRPPIYFKNADSIDVPAGSELVARITGTDSPTRLKVSTNLRARYLPLTRLGPDSFETSTTVRENSVARWRVGNRIESWRVNAITDQPPRISVAGNPEADKRDRLSITYSFDDDYGVEELFLIMNLHTDDAEKAKEISRVDIPLSGSVREARDKTSALDLTKHKWAGQKVVARLYARDGAGQSMGSGNVYFIVPDKIFIEPLAKAIIEQRGLVIAARDQAYGPVPEYNLRDWQTMPWFDTYQPRERLDRAPAEIQQVAALIDAVTDSPAGLFRDPAVFMGLKNIESRLRYARHAEALAGVPEDLWSIAIRAEFGVLGSALEEMREAEAALREGIACRAPQREIDTLFERYNEAVDRYMDELRRKALEDGNIAEGGQGGGGDNRNTDEIQELLDAIEEANRIGDTEGARLALARLAELLENMQMQLSAGGGGEGGEPMEGEMSEEMKEALEDLADLLGEQRELQDETRQAENESQQQGEQSGAQQGEQQGQGSQNGNQGGEQQDGEQNAPGSGALSPQELARQQEGLEEALEALREVVPEDEGNQIGGGEEDGEAGGGGENDEEGVGGSAQDALDEAARAMRESREALGGEQFGSARDAQSDAIRALRRAGERLAEQAGNQEGRAGREAENSDPLGRDANGVNDENSEADIDQRDNATRSREILEELRRRASEQEREQLEREYLERLLERF